MMYCEGVNVEPAEQPLCWIQITNKHPVSGLEAVPAGLYLHLHSDYNILFKLLAVYLDALTQEMTVDTQIIEFRFYPLEKKFKSCTLRKI